jgi:hypothetical protein
MIDRQYSSYCFLASELSIEKKNILDRQHIASQWGLQLIVRMHNSDPTPQGVENRNRPLNLPQYPGSNNYFNIPEENI